MKVVSKTESGPPESGESYCVYWPYMRDHDAIKENEKWREDVARDRRLYPKRRDLVFVGPENLQVAWEWKPGLVCEPHEDGGDHCYADGLGRAEIEVISVHRPGPRYDYRVFYKIVYVDPYSARRGGKALKCATLSKFNVMVDGVIKPNDWDVELKEIPAPKLYDWGGLIKRWRPDDESAA